MLKNNDFLGSLPAEILTLIFPYLGKEKKSEALIALMQTCWRNYLLVSADNNLKNYAPLLYKVRSMNSLKKELRSDLIEEIKKEKIQLTNIKKDLLDLRKQLIEFQRGMFYDDILPLRKNILSQKHTNFFHISGYVKTNKITSIFFLVFALLFLAVTFFMIYRIFNLDSSIKDLQSNFNEDDIKNAYNDYTASTAYDPNDPFNDPYHPLYTASVKNHDFAWRENQWDSFHWVTFEHHPSACDQNTLHKLCEEDKGPPHNDFCLKDPMDQFNMIRNGCISRYEKWVNLTTLNNTISVLKNTLVTSCKLTSAFPSALVLQCLIQLARILYVRKKMALKKYIDLSVNYLTKDHAQRFHNIKMKYAKEIAKEKITTVSDLTNLLEKIYYETPPNPNNLLIECEEYINKIDNILKSNEIAFKSEIFKSTPRITFYRNIGTFSEKANNVLKDNLKMTNSVLLDIEETENSFLLENMA